MTIDKQQFHWERLMLDSECMMLDDQDMAEEWIVRVEGKEYGPADIETLREWKREGRLLPENEARKAGADLWSAAAAIPGLFNVGPIAPASVPRPTQPPLQTRQRSFGQILADTVHIYRKGFFRFLGLTLLVLLPSLVTQAMTAIAQTGRSSDADVRVLAAGVFALLMFVLSTVMWPVYIAGIQIVTAEIAGGRRSGLVAALNEAVRFWPRVAALCIFVYGVFFLLIVFGLVIAAMALAGGSSLLLILFALGLLFLQVWMFGRFFVNVLFWQQFAVLENAAFIDSLRDSRNLAHSGRDLPWFKRPLWRGAFIASLWFAFVLAVTLVSEWTTLHHYFDQLMTTQDPQALLQRLTEAQQARGFDVSAFVLNLVQKILQPLLGIAFVVLYLNSKIHLER
jgi:GYF domain 2